MNYAELALRQIELADLSAAEYRMARRLLDRAQHNGGVVQLEPEDAARVCGVASWASARRVLAAIATAGIVSCRTHGAAQVIFTAWFDAAARAATMQSIEQEPLRIGATRADTHHSEQEAELHLHLTGSVEAEPEHQVREFPQVDGANRADSASTREPGAASLREIDAKRAELARPGGSSSAQTAQDLHTAGQNGAGRTATTHSAVDTPHTCAGARSLGSTTTTGRQEDLPLPACLPAEGGVGETVVQTDAEADSLEPPEWTSQRHTSDAERTIALLTDSEIGWDMDGAANLAATYSFEQVRAQVFRARREMAAGKISSFGIIKRRLERSYGAAVVEADRQSSLWRRHATVEDDHAERRRKYFPDEYQDIIIG